MGTKVNDYAIGDANLTSVMDTLDRQRKGYHGVSLTEYDTDNEPEIAAGSLVEVGGALYKFDTNEPIGDAASDDPIDGDLYIRLVPDGDDITADFTNIEPVWDDSKQGFYGTGGAANYRYIGGMTLDAGAYSDKYIYIHVNNNVFKIYGSGKVYIDNLKIGVIDMYGTGDEEIFSLTASQEKEFNIKKPCIIIVVISAVDLGGDIIYFGYSDSAYQLNLGMINIGGSDANSLGGVISQTGEGFAFDLVYPGRYKYVCDGTVATRTFHVLYVEGQTDITDVDEFYEEI